MQLGVTCKPTLALADPCLTSGGQRAPYLLPELCSSLHPVTTLEAAAAEQTHGEAHPLPSHQITTATRLSPRWALHEFKNNADSFLSTPT